MAINFFKVELPGEPVSPKLVITRELKRNELPLRARPASLAPSPDTVCVHECGCVDISRNVCEGLCFGRCPAKECFKSCLHRLQTKEGEKSQSQTGIFTVPCWSCVQLSPSRWAGAPAAEHPGYPRAAPWGAQRNSRPRQTPGPVCAVPVHWLN